MDSMEAIRSRRSIRVFDDRIPPKETILECLEAATWAPNPTNQQPWEFIVVTGNSLKKISETIMKTFPQRMKNVDPYSGIPESCEKRKNETFEKILSAAKEAEIDTKDLFRKNLTFYGAPVAVFFVTYILKHSIYRHATVAALQNFLLAAHDRGLGTCWLSSVAACQEEIKPLLKIPDAKEILDGVALGYPELDSPLNSYPRSRLPVNEITKWFGF